MMTCIIALWVTSGLQSAMFLLPTVIGNCRTSATLLYTFTELRVCAG